MDLAQAAAVSCAAAGNAWRDGTYADHAALPVEVIAAVGEQLPRLAPRPRTLAADRRDRVLRRQQLSDVVSVTTGQGDRERDPVGVDDQVVLRAVGGQHT